MKIALAGDTMLGRQVGEHLVDPEASPLFADEVVAVAREADLLVLNLECAISDRGERWADPNKLFFFRAPPTATRVLENLGVLFTDCVGGPTEQLGPAVAAAIEPADHLAPELTLPQAQQRLDVDDEPWLFFKDPASGRGQVLYRRYDGHYGLITPTGESVAKPSALHG
jgi:hypothetical protein